MSFRVLYAEDNPADAELTRVHFSRHAPDFHIEIVGTGQACLDRVPEAQWDLLLLDNRLPDMDGLHVLRALVRAGSLVPAVLITDSGDEELVVKALRLGAANYVPKLGDYLTTLPELLRLIIDQRQTPSRGLLAGGPRRILYVEHQAIDIDLTLHHFAEAAPQIELQIARTCEEALRLLDHGPAFDAVLIDLRMPDQSGLELIREAKRRGLRLPPFIMISGKGDEDAAIASLTLGAADYIAKRDGYLDQLPYTIERAVAYDQLDRANAHLQTELAERKRVEQELRFRNAILDTQQNTSLDGILVVDGGGRLVSSNRRFAHMWGIPADVIASQSDERALKAVLDKLANPEEFIAKVKYLYGHHEERSEDEISLKDGRTFDRYSAPMRGQDGGYFGRVWYFRDITARKHAERERQKLEEQLRVSQKMEAIGSLAGGIAHDFNNLLSVILSYTGFAIDALPEDSSIRHDLLQVRMAGISSAAMVRQLLAFSRKQLLQSVPLDLNEVVAGIGKMLARVVGENIDLVQSLAPDLGLTLADPGQVEQVVMNLVVNARDAMPEGGRLAIETTNIEVDEEQAAQQRDMKAGSYVQLTITDSGCGMDETTKARIFEPFFTTKEEGKGTGLGLSTVFGIVRQTGGCVRVDSTLGKGTTFRICLPRETAAGTPRRVIASRVPASATGTETILLVEDEDALRPAATRGLEMAGYIVLSAASGEEALRVVSRHAGDIHLLLTDVVMPGKDGQTLASELCRMLPGLKVVYMSGYTDDAIIHRSVPDGPVHFLAKPFTATSLAQKVREVLDFDPTRSVGQPTPPPESRLAGRERAGGRVALDHPLRLASLPGDLAARLRAAATAAHYDDLCSIIEEVSLTAPPLAGELRRMAGGFDYAGIRELLGQ